MSIESDLLYNEAACGLVLTEVDGTLITANKTLCAWLGREWPLLDGAARFQDLLTVGARIFHQTHWLPLMHMQGSLAEVKLDFVHSSGRKLPMVVNAHVVTLPDGRTCHSIAAYVASDRDTYERELVKARKNAEELLRERTQLQHEASERGLFAEQLIGIVSHDLRNPLTAIRMGTDMLVQHETNARRLRVASRINESVDRALSLVEDLLDFTLTKTERALAIDKASVDLHAVAAKAIEELRWAFPGVVIEHVARGPGQVEADTERLVRVLGNLVANAARYGDIGQPIIVESTTASGLATLQVCNSGPPIPAELMPRIFQPMTRGESHHGGGVGLGLYIVSQIAAAHGGRPTVASDPASGTRVGIEFPVLASSEVEPLIEATGALPTVSANDLECPP